MAPVNRSGGKVDVAEVDPDDKAPFFGLVDYGDEADGSRDWDEVRSGSASKPSGRRVARALLASAQMPCTCKLWRCSRRSLF